MEICFFAENVYNPEDPVSNATRLQRENSGLLRSVILRFHRIYKWTRIQAHQSFSMGIIM